MKWLVLLWLFALSVQGHARSVDVVKVRAYARQLIDRGEIDSAMACYKDALRHYDSEDEAHADDWGTLYNNLGYLQLIGRNEYMSAFNNLLIAKDICQQHGLTELSAFVYINLANLYAIYDDPENMFDAAVKAFEISHQVKAWPTMSLAFSMLVTSSFLNNPRCVGTIKRLIAVWDRSHLPDSVLMVTAGRYERLAAQAWFDRDYPSALRHIESARSHVDNWNDPDLGRYSCDWFAIDVLQKMGRTSEAIAVAKNILAQSADHSRPWHVVALGQLAELYRSTGRADSAIEYQTRYLLENDSLMKGQQYGLLRNIEKAFIEQAGAKREAARQREKQALIRWLCVAVAFLVVIAVAAAVIAVQYQRLRQRTAALFERGNEILKLKLALPAPPAGIDGEDARVMERVNGLLLKGDVIGNPDFSMQQMAKLLDLPIKTLSRVVNSSTGDNFSVLLANARVALSASLLADRASDRLTIEAVGRSVGFLSRSNFAVNFRRVMGLNPSEYRKQAQRSELKQGEICTNSGQNG